MPIRTDFLKFLKKARRKSENFFKTARSNFRTEILSQDLARSVLRTQSYDVFFCTVKWICMFILFYFDPS